MIADIHECEVAYGKFKEASIAAINNKNPWILRWDDVLYNYLQKLKENYTKEEAEEFMNEIRIVLARLGIR